MGSGNGSRFRRALIGVLSFTAVGCGSSAPGATSTTNKDSPGIAFSVSGGVAALNGYDFLPAVAGSAAFVDGWAVRFDRILVTIDKVKMYAKPDKAADDQSQTDPEVAEVDGPWAVDLHKSDPNNLQGRGGPGEQAVHFAQLTTEDLAGGGRFQADGTRYAFGFDLVTASDSAKNLNLDFAASADYETMIQNGCAVFYAGTATFKGDKTDPSCYPDDRKSFPDEVNFRFCFKSPTTYLNCDNPDNDPATPLGNEEHQRGIAVETDRQVMAQVSIHVEYPFWDSVLHDSPVHFDQFAARVTGQTGTPTVTLEDTKNVDYAHYVDAQNNALNWRYCIEPPTNVHPKFTGTMAFDSNGVPRSDADPSLGFRDYDDFATYDQSTQAHLNSEGACFVKRNYPSPQGPTP